jgi:hypothetical protein
MHLGLQLACANGKDSERPHRASSTSRDVPESAASDKTPGRR